MKIPGLCRHDRRSCAIAGLVGNPSLDPQDRVQPINHCGDTYKVATDGKVRDFWERNLRFKTDVSDDGPQKGAPALVGAGMMGDRADVIFDWPEEISGFIANADQPESGSPADVISAGRSREIWRVRCGRGLWRRMPGIALFGG
jgi:hypothetical protein